MTTSKLADKLEEYEVKGLVESSSAVTFLNLPTIIKSLRFAADMERLLLRRPCFTNNENDCTIRVTTGSVERIGFHGSDIYKAARKAVEALEGRDEH